MQFPDSDFWDFSIGFYNNADVEKSCLSLQDNHSLNVNLILFCFWLGLKHKEKLEHKQLQKLINISLPWEEITVSLRKSRLMLKHSPIAMPADFKQETNEGVCKLELNTEHMQQLALEQEWKKIKSTPSDEKSEDIIRHNIKTYLRATQHNIAAEAVENEIRVLIENTVKV